MRLLVLGGTRFVGRAVVADALGRRWDVTAVHRGITGTLPDGVTGLLADRTSTPALTTALGDATWDLVVDTWAGAPAVATSAARVLAGRVGGFGYVSSASVHTWGSHVDEGSPLVDADPAEGLSGPVDAISRSGHATTRELLEACVAVTGSDAELVWISEDDLAGVGAEPWTQLPCWVPGGGEFAGFLEGETSRAAATGSVCRTVQETARDTWGWLLQDGAAAQRGDRPVHGLPAELEARLLAAHG